MKFFILMLVAIVVLLIELLVWYCKWCDVTPKERQSLSAWWRFLCRLLASIIRRLLRRLRKMRKLQVWCKAWYVERFL